MTDSSDNEIRRVVLDKAIDNVLTMLDSPSVYGGSAICYHLTQVVEMLQVMKEKLK